MKLTKQDIQNLLEMYDLSTQSLTEAYDDLVLSVEEYKEKHEQWRLTIEKILKAQESPSEAS